ncbi:MAG: bifunctional adenosylcobinamide kinase/adenosylcobinamide-phosphate guanylyltransferase [Clostridia bacterium]|nr:bifunctional adenosylcobinamide kinase/adenosylcobinamide-phosphate guanylyltransferase [Clostridia bacterium]
MNVYISGGCKNGKSHYAQEVARDMAKELNLPLYYVATMIPHDEEDERRIARHITERDGWGFTTIEQGVDIQKAFRGEGVYLLDSVTALIQNEMFPGKAFNLEAHLKVAEDLKEFANLAKNVVFVSDYIFSDARHFDDITLKYMEGLAYLDKTMAKVCDRVAEVSFGNVIEWKK